MRLLVVPIIRVKPQFFLLSMHRGRSVMRVGLFGRETRGLMLLAIALTRLRESFAFLVASFFKDKHSQLPLFISENEIIAVHVKNISHYQKYADIFISSNEAEIIEKKNAKMKIFIEFIEILFILLFIQTNYLSMYQPQQLQQPIYSFGGSLNHQPLIYSQAAPTYLSPQYNPIAASQVYAQLPPINSRIVPIQVQPQNSLQYSQLQPYYSVHQQPAFLPPNYLVQPMSVMRRHPQTDINLNFDYESANFLVESKITESTIYCVLCQIEYKANQRDQHIKKHIRPVSNRPPLRDVDSKLPNQSKTIISKPIVEPEQFNIQYKPTVYRLNKQIVFEDQRPIEKKDISLGFDDVENEVNSVYNAGSGNSMNVPVNILNEEQPQMIISEPSINPSSSVLNEPSIIVTKPFLPRQEQTVLMQPQNLGSLIQVSPTGNVVVNNTQEEQPFSLKQNAVPTMVNSNEEPSSFSNHFARETFEIQPSNMKPEDLHLKREETKQKEEFIGQPVEIRPSVPRPLRSSEDSFNEILKGVTSDVQIEGGEKKRMPSRVQW